MRSVSRHHRLTGASKFHIFFFWTTVAAAWQTLKWWHKSLTIISYETSREARCDKWPIPALCPCICEMNIITPRGVDVSKSVWHALRWNPAFVGVNSFYAGYYQVSAIQKCVFPADFRGRWRSVYTDLRPGMKPPSGQSRTHKSSKTNRTHPRCVMLIH